MSVSAQNNQKSQINFYDLQEKITQYHKDKKPKEIPGYKQYKRWENMMEERVYPSGEIPDGGKIIWDWYLKNSQQGYQRDNTSDLCPVTSGASWQEVGPRYVNKRGSGKAGHGRLNFVRFFNENIYVGSPGGGIWTSPIDAINWQVAFGDDRSTDFNLINDVLCLTGVTDMLIHPSNPDIILVATGDAFGNTQPFITTPNDNTVFKLQNNFDIYSIGLLRSTDGGETWTPVLNPSDPMGGPLEGNPNSQQKLIVMRIALDPHNSNHILVSTNVGLYESDDLGQTWDGIDINNMLGFIESDKQIFYDIAFHPTVAGVVYVSTHEGEVYRRIYNTTTGSFRWGSWQATGLSAAPHIGHRVALSISSTTNDEGQYYIYAIVSDDYNMHGVYRLADAGTPVNSINLDPVFTLQYNGPINLLGRNADNHTGNNGTDGQAYYDLAISVDPADNETVYVGGIDMWKSEDGGTNWDKITTGTSGVHNESAVNTIDGQLGLNDDGYTDAVWQRRTLTAPDNCPADGTYYYDFYTITPNTAGTYNIVMQSDNPEDPGALNGYLVLGHFTEDDIVNTITCAGGSIFDASGVDGTTTLTQFLQNDTYNLMLTSVNAGSQGDYTISITPNIAAADGATSAGFATPIAKVHPDIHTIMHYGGNVYIGCDGGLYSSEDDGLTWSDLSSGLGITQFYRFSVRGNNILGGAQDNGILGNENLENLWNVITGGDGCESYISQDNRMYATTQRGAINRTQENPTFGYLEADQILNPEDLGETSRFVTSAFNVFERDADTDVLYVGYNNIYRSTDNGNNFQNITNGQIHSVSTEVVGTIEVFSEDIIYASRYSTGDIFKTTNGSVASPTWTTINGTAPDVLPNLSITDIEVDSKDANHVWVTFSGYDETNKVYETYDGGNSWYNITANLLPNLPVNTIAYYSSDDMPLPPNNNILYVGTDAGVFYARPVPNFELNRNFILSSGIGAPTLDGINLNDFYQDVSSLPNQFYEWNGSDWLPIFHSVTEGLSDPPSLPGIDAGDIYRSTNTGNVYEWQGLSWLKQQPLPLIWNMFNHRLTFDGTTIEYIPQLPNAMITELEIDNHTLYASTYGRGIWRSALATGNCLACDNPLPLYDITVKEPEVSDCNNYPYEWVGINKEIEILYYFDDFTNYSFEWFLDYDAVTDDQLSGTNPDFDQTYLSVHWTSPGMRNITLKIIDHNNFDQCYFWTWQVEILEENCTMDYLLIEDPITDIVQPTCPDIIGSIKLNFDSYYHLYYGSGCYWYYLYKDGDLLQDNYIISDVILSDLKAGTYYLEVVDEVSGCYYGEEIELINSNPFDYSYTTDPAYTQTTTSTGIQLSPNPDCSMVTVSLVGDIPKEAYPINLEWVNYVGTLNEGGDIDIDWPNTTFPSIEVCGNAQLSITDKNGCSLIFNMSGNNATVDNSGGGNENPSATKTNGTAGESYFKIIPNPFKEQVSLHYNINRPEDVKEDIIPISIKAIHISGRYAVELVQAEINFNQNYTQSISMSELPTGLYIFTLKTPHQNLITKGIKY